MTQITTINDNAWTELGTALTVCVVQFTGRAEVYVGSAAPGASDVGFNIESGDPVEIPQVAALGGGVWVRSILPNSGVRYATAS